MNIVITGTSRGIGRELACYYLEAGHKVFGCSRSDSTIDHASYWHVQADLSSAASVAELAKAVRQEWSIVDALINNAGAASMNAFLLTPSETAERLFRVNYLSAFNCSREFARLLRKAPHPRIVNFTTVAVPLDLEGELAYASMKAAVEEMTRILAKELSTFKITVNAVGPSPAPTGLIAGVPEGKLELILQRQSVKRYTTFEDIENVIDFYLSEKSDFITGQIMYLGGVF